jgi:hypothetical protein
MRSSGHQSPWVCLTDHIAVKHLISWSAPTYPPGHTTWLQGSSAWGVERHLVSVTSAVACHSSPHGGGDRERLYSVSLMRSEIAGEAGCALLRYGS